MKKIITLAFAFAVFCVFAVVGVCSTSGDIAYANELTVKVGYSGGPYYVKHVYTDDELWSLTANERYEYTFEDKGQNRLIKAYGWGPTVEAIFSNAYDSLGTAVNASSLWRFHMATEDNYIPDDTGTANDGYGYTAWWWTNPSGAASGVNCLGGTRYCYPDLGGTYTYTDAAGITRTGSNFDYENSVTLSSRVSAIESTRQSVAPIIALRWSWVRIGGSGSSVYYAEKWDQEKGPSSPDECSRSDNRLLFGQVSLADVNGMASAHSVNAIICIYDGKPEVEVTTESGETSFYGDIGTTITAKATVRSADALIDQNAADYVNWTVTDDNGDDVTDDYLLTRNDDGTVSITITGNGNVKLNASYGNSTADEFVASNSMGGGGPHSDYDPDQGSNQGYGDGSGAGGTGGSGNGGDGIDGSSSGTTSTGVDSSTASADSSGGGSSSSGGGGGAAGQAQYEVQKVIDDNELDQLQPEIDISQLPWGGILLVFAIVLGAALSRIGAYLWDVDRRRFLKKTLPSTAQEATAA